ncbi:hypothetical protein D3C80_909790 [compost metagenome]
MARGAHAGIVGARRVRNRCRVNQIIVKHFIDILHAFGGQQHFSRPRDVLMTQAVFKGKALLFDEGVTVDIEPGDVQELARFQRHLQPCWAIQHTR